MIRQVKIANRDRNTICQITYPSLLLFSLICLLLFLFPHHSHATGELEKIIINDEDTIEKTLPPSKIHEECFRLNQNQILDYVFEASKPLEFNLHHHMDNEVIYPIPSIDIAAKKGRFTPKIKKVYCLMWTNAQLETVDLNYQLQIKKKQSSKIPVRFQVDNKRENIQIIDSTGATRAQIKVGESIHNFGLNHSITVLAVLTSSQNNAVMIYDIATQKLKHAIALPTTPRFLAFSQNDQYLALAEEHTNTLTLLETTSFKEVGTIRLPDTVVALDTSDQSNNQLLARTNTGILKIGLEPLEIIEKNAKIPVLMGKETVYINPTEWCFVHGVPHPLYYPTSAMSTSGLSGFLPPDWIQQP